MKIFEFVALTFLGLGMIGCASYAIPPYKGSLKNVKLAQKLKREGKDFPAVGVVVDPSFPTNKIRCRGANLEIVDSKSFAEYIQNAINFELAVADVSEKSPNSAGLQLLDIQVDSVTGLWTVSGVLNYDGLLKAVGVKMAFPATFNGISACMAASESFVFVVQELNEHVLSAIDEYRPGKK